MDTEEAQFRGEVADALLDAVALMNDEGKHWTQGTYVGWVDGERRFCAIGGIRVATGYYHEDSISHNPVTFKPDVYRGCEVAVASVIILDGENRERVYETGAEIANSMDAVISFNDNSETDWAEVKDTFVEAARRVRDGDVPTSWDGYGQLIAAI